MSSTKTIIINGVEHEVKVLPPGRAEGAYFQNFGFDRKSFGRLTDANVNPPGEEPPAQVSLAEELMASAMTLHEIISEGK
jgi:hypothetical protein